MMMRANGTVITADYTAPRMLRAVLKLIYKLEGVLFAWIKNRHIERIVGLEHLPACGPFIIVANHLSYLDDFLLAYVIKRYYGEKLYIPTNKKAFKGVWRRGLHLAGGAVEIDPQQREHTYAVLSQLLADQKIILMFPEGTRSDGTQLLPFRFGAFNLAKNCQVPLVPAALLNTHRVLPKHRLWCVRSEQAALAFLPAITPSAFDHASVADIKETCRQALATHIYKSDRWRQTAAAAATAQHLATRAEQHIEALIARGTDTLTAAQIRPVFAWTELAQFAVANSPAVAVQYFRAFGFWLLCAPRWRALLLLQRFHLLGAQALQRDAHQPFVHYVRGQFYLRAPWWAGGGKHRALVALQQAYQWAEHYGIQQVRFAIAYAEALWRNGMAVQAQQLLQQHFATPPTHDARLQRRYARARNLLTRIQSAADFKTNTSHRVAAPEHLT